MTNELFKETLRKARRAAEDALLRRADARSEEAYALALAATRKVLSGIEIDPTTANEIAYAATWDARRYDL